MCKSLHSIRLLYIVHRATCAKKERKYASTESFADVLFEPSIPSLAYLIAFVVPELHNKQEQRR